MVSAQHVSTFRANQFVPRLREDLAHCGLATDHVILRCIGRDRIDLALQKGSDRDATSELYNVPVCDSDPSTRRAHHIRDEQVTFCLDVDLTRDGCPVLNADNAPWTAQLDTLADQNLESYSAYLVYDPSKIQKAPNATVEFWLPQQPQSALVAAYVSDVSRPGSENLSPRIEI